jgi:ABC-type oligopeptide transport system substrate-binding subunit
VSRSKTTLAITSLALGLFLTACDNSEAVKEEKKEAPLAPVQQEQSMQPPAATGQELGDFIPPTQERVTQLSAKAMTNPYSITLVFALGEEEQ